MNRRDFIKIAGSAAAAAGFATMPTSIRRALAIPAQVDSGSIHDVQHVVILMQENRSFDHYFGTLRGVRGFKDRFPIPTATGKPVWSQWNGEREVQPFHLDSDTMNAALVASLPHTFSDAQAAWGQGQLSFWPQFKTDASMGYYTRKEAPFQYALADAFTICDAYHCSLQSSTGPNRIVFWSGTNADPLLRDRGINGDERSAEVVNLRTVVSGQMPEPGYQFTGEPFHWPTIPELLESSGISWKIYQDPNQNWSGLMHGALASRRFRDARPGSPLYEKGMRHHSLRDLQADVLGDRLPSVSWILPPPLKSEHPGAPSSAAQGGNYVEQILQALTANPAVWSRTVFLVTFDENDGFFDHVPPPSVPSIYRDGSLAGKSTLDVNGMYFVADPSKHLHPSDRASSDLRPWGMGPRVPMYVISPWSRGGWVNSQVFDHTSVGMFLERRFGITIDAISAWHRAVSGDLSSAFDFANPNLSPQISLPDTRDYALIEQRAAAMPPAKAPVVPQARFQEPGTRYSRALPYALDVRAMSKRGRLMLTFCNLGAQGAVFHVYDRHRLEQLPRRYTVEAGRQLDDDYWDSSATDGHFHLEVFGPNGFYRMFKGLVGDDVGADLALELAHDLREGRAGVKVTNLGNRAETIVFQPNAYLQRDPWSLTLNAHGTTYQTWPAQAQGFWYDITVKTEAMEQRMAGRIETGAPSFSDPAAA